ncbi:MAG: MOSC N-terminal beta barrel domain-containing protein [Actinomycetes bacterium]
MPKVSSVWIYPVKSMQGIELPSASVLLTGLAGDRQWSVVDAETGEPVRAKEAPRLREVTPSLVERDGDWEVALDVPGALPRLTGEAAEAALSAFVGRPVRLQRQLPGEAGYVDVAPVHVVSRQAIEAAVAAGDSCDACDAADPRANLVLDLPPGEDPLGGNADPAAADAVERGWVGGDVAVGQAVLTITKVPKHCLGVYAEVVAPGVVAVDDEVRAPEVESQQP